jgi:MoxR-like ATPase
MTKSRTQPPNDTPAAPTARRGLLRALGIAGWDALEPAILAALATESPLLLVGPHGSAKTLLLARLAEALGLAFRHYNASILSFDDLLGYPVPQDGRLVYLETPATIWQAEAVLFDEVSSCRTSSSRSSTRRSPRASRSRGCGTAGPP